MPARPQLIFCNGRILIDGTPASAVEAIAVTDGRVSGSGDTETLRAEAGPDTRIVDLEGRTVLPGFIDAHGHLELMAYSWGIAVNLRSSEVSSIEEMIEKLGEASASMPEGEWLMGHGEHYQSARLAEGRYPDVHDLDRVSLERPVVVRFSFHQNIFNSAALRALGLDRNSPDAPGGRLERDENGELTGRTFDMWTALDVDGWSDETVKAGIVKVQDMMLSAGLTALGDLPMERSAVDALHRMSAEDSLKLRLTVYPKYPPVWGERFENFDEIADRFAAEDQSRLRLGGVKIFLDGGLTANAAAMNEPYPGTDDYYGELSLDQDQLNDMVRFVDSKGLQMAIHAIGDRSLDMCIEAMTVLGHPEGRHRVEHAGNLFVTPERIAAIKSAGIVPMPQPAFIYTTAEGYIRSLGEQRTGTPIPLKTLIESGLQVPGNSDAIGLTPDQHAPFLSIWAAVTRTTTSGNVINPEQRISLEQAITMYTRDAAYAVGRETEIGTLETGKFADLIVLDRDPYAIPAEELRDVRVERVWVGGEHVYQAA